MKNLVKHLVKDPRIPLLASPSFASALLLGVPVLTAPVFAADVPALPTGPVTSVDAPAPYRYLDWVSRDEIDTLPLEQRPQHTGVCPGYYLPPVVVPRETVDDDTKAPLEASAEHYEMVGDSQVMMRGGVVVQQGTRMLESDQLELDTQTKQAQLKDNVRVRQAGMLMTGEKADIDLTSKKLAVENAEYVIHANHIRGTASRIHNTSRNVLVLDRSTYTTCEPGANTWYFQADDLRLNAPLGWGTAKHMVIKVKDIPVFYLPWFMFPIDDRRQSGFLFPEPINLDRSGGFEIGLPYYLNLAPNYDATITPVILSKRGTVLNTEFRYLTPTSEGDVGGGYMQNDKLYDGEKRHFRYWHHDSDFKNGWSTHTDYSRVSDRDYFNDIDSDLNASAMTHLNQLAQTNYRTDHWNFLGLVQQFQTLDKLAAPDDEPYRRVPQLRADGGNQLSWPGWYWTLGSEAVLFEHPNALATLPHEAQRLTLSPGVGYRIENAYSYVSPRLRSISTQYDVEPGAIDAVALATFDESPDINTYIASMDSGLIFERNTRWFGNEQTQTLEPRAFLLYVPREDEQNAIPLFDTAAYTFSYDQLFRENRFTGGDRYGDEKKLALGVTTRLISDDTGEEWLRMSVGQAFYFDDRFVQLSAETPPQETDTSALAGRIVWQMARNWFFYHDVEWDSDVNNIDNMNTGFQVNKDNEYLVNFGYLYHDDEALTASPEDEKLKQTDLSFILPLTARWSLLGRWGYDVELNRSFDNMVGVEYDSCCWRFRVISRRFLQESDVDVNAVEPKPNIAFQIELKGLAGLRSGEKWLEDSISGYQDREEQRKYRF